MSKLYVVGTPIGNLGDFSPRGIDTLHMVDFIAAEDTRVSRGLLTHFEISTPMISYHQHNQKERGMEIVSRILNGENCAIITDAGMPAISDPGEDLVRLCAEHSIEIVVVPGPTAVLSALAISGLPTRRFSFEGFLEGKDSQQRELLLQVKDYPSTLIYYEAPHKLLHTLELMYDVFGNRNIALCREITKMYEEVVRTTIKEAISLYQETAPRGEFVLVIEGKQPDMIEELSIEQAIQMVQERSQQGVSLSQAAKEVAEITGYKKGTLYKGAL